MAKRKETLELETALAKQARDKRVYGCEEVTIGFHNQGSRRKEKNHFILNKETEARRNENYCNY